MIRTILTRLADFLTADARAEHEQVGRPDIVFRPRTDDHAGVIISEMEADCD